MKHQIFGNQKPEHYVLCFINIKNWKEGKNKSSEYLEEQVL